VSITGPQLRLLDRHGRPGHSAKAEYRRRRATDWQTWKPTLALRIAAMLTAAAALAWRLRFRPTADTGAWRRGGIGERRTARLLAPLERHGYQVFHHLAIPGSAATSTTWSSAPPECS
jgi:hypothetical protein